MHAWQRPLSLLANLADRICLVLAHSLSSPAYTADRPWQTWADDLDIEVRLFC
jgi:ribonuclease VapC